MKFLCDNCKAKYQIGDDKVAGKTVRMKCRKCGHSIQVTASMAEGDATTADVAAPMQAAISSVTIEPAASPPAAPAPAPRAAAPIARPAPVRLEDPPTDDESTSIMTFPMPDGPKAPGAPGPVATRTPLTSSSMRPAIAARPAPPAKPIAPAPPPRPAGATSATLTAARVAGAPRPIAPRVPAPRPPNAPPSGPQSAGIAGAFARGAVADAPPPAAARAAVSEDWYVGIGGVPLGPVKVAVIRDKALAGVVDGESLVWREGLDEWRPLKTVPELLEVVSGPIALRRSSTQIPAVAQPAAAAEPAPAPHATPAPHAAVAAAPTPPPAPASHAAMAAAPALHATPAAHAASAPHAAPAPHVSTSITKLTPPNTMHAPSTTLMPSAAVAHPSTALTPLTTALTPPSAALTLPTPTSSEPTAMSAAKEAHVAAPIAHAAAPAAATALTNGKAAPLHVLSDPFAAPAATPAPPAAAPAIAPASSPEPAIAAAAPEPSAPVPSAPVPSAPVSTAGTTAPVKPAMEADLGDLVRVPRPAAHHPMAYAFILAAAVFSGVAAWALFAKAPQQIVVVQQAASTPVKTEAKEKEPDTQPQVEVGDVVPGATGGAARPGVAQVGLRPKASAAASSGPAPAPLDTSGFSNTVPGPMNAPVGAPPVGGGQLSQGEISGVVAQNQPLVKRKCWQPALESRSANGPTNARVNGSLTIGPSGNVDAASANGAERDFPGLSSCIAGRMKGWKFPPSGSSTTVNVPFVFAGQ